MNNEFEKWWQSSKEREGFRNGYGLDGTDIKTAFEAGQATLQARIDELEEDCKVMAESLIKTHRAANCGNNKAMDYIRHGAILKVCPACTIAAKYR